MPRIPLKSVESTIDIVSVFENRAQLQLWTWEPNTVNSVIGTLEYGYRVGMEYGWRYGYYSMTSLLDSAPGIGKIECLSDGDDLQYKVYLHGTHVLTEVFTGWLASYDIAYQRALISAAWHPDSSRHYETTIVKYDESEDRYPWDSSDELLDWSVYGSETPDIVSGHLTQTTYKGWNIYRDYSPVLVSMLGACLARPGIERTVACTDDGQLSERYEAGAFDDILSGDAIDAHPELCYTGAAGIGHLALVWQRDDDVVCATSSGVPTSGWSDVATVREDRSYPTACVIAPTHDLYVVAIESSVHIAHGQRLRWKGTSYDIGTESIVSSGDVADERGHVLCAPGNVLVYTYADTSGDIQVLRSSDGGSTWA